ncbi:hypothetical protein KQX54_011824 [Cotesia glomerata]|uniref:Peptidase A2 domain-containing protein n=1 Tax=Cotesia glomerata TaxID=32391 RepID=A0AAV7HWU1_COTGL|nr:hypothetical protein KQX54_011824 [Cotesia glomerata]
MLVSRMITDITIGPFHIEAMLDSGSERSYISETAYNRIQGNELQELSPDSTSTVGVILADSASTYTRGGAPFELELDGKTILTWLSVLPGLSIPVILGLDFWQSTDVHVESKIATWYLGGNSTKHQFRSRTNKTKPLTLNALSSSERSELMIFPLRQQTGKEVIKHLRGVLTHWGPVKQIISDMEKSL